MQQPVIKLGVDSLMAVELKNRIESDLGLTVPVTALLQGPSLAHLSARLVTQLRGARCGVGGTSRAHPRVTTPKSCSRRWTICPTMPSTRCSGP